MFCVRLLTSSTGIPVPGLDAGNAATSTNETVVDTMFLILSFLLWRLIIRDHVGPSENQILDDEYIETVTRSNFKGRRNREIFLQECRGRGPELLPKSRAQGVGRAGMRSRGIALRLADRNSAGDCRHQESR